jgi:hypothetical protein
VEFWPWHGDYQSPSRETLRRLRHIAEQNRQILALLAPAGELMSDLTNITTAVEAERNVVDSAVVLLTQLAQDLEAARNDPAAIQQIVDNINAQKDTLAAAVVANTPAAPTEPPPASATTQPAVGDDFAEKIAGETYAEHVARAEAAGLKPKSEADWDALPVG